MIGGGGGGIRQDVNARKEIRPQQLLGGVDWMERGPLQASFRPLVPEWVGEQRLIYVSCS